MRKAVMGALMVMLMVTTNALAQGAGGVSLLDDVNFRPTMAGLTTMLALTPDQVKQIVPMRDSMLMATKDQRDEATALRARLQAAQQSGGSADSASALKQEMQRVMISMMPARMHFLNSVRTVLTSAQVQVFDRNRQEMTSAMGPWTEQQ